MESERLNINMRDAFLEDLTFQKCWDIVERERKEKMKLKTSGTPSFIEEEGDGVEQTIPWKWNNMGKLKEFFGPHLSDTERSPGVDITKWFYQILLHVPHFKANDLHISLTNRSVIVKGTQEETEDELGLVSRNFTRKYTLPADIEMDRVECYLSSDGVLHIIAPRSFQPDEVIVPKESLHHSTEFSFFGDSPEEIKRRDNELAAASEEPVVNIDGEHVSVHALPDFDMVPFWARELPTHPRFGIKSDEGCFKVLIDMGQFEPEEISVLYSGHHIIVEGNQEEKEDSHGLIACSFCRKYWLPRWVSPNDINCTLSKDRVLEIFAPILQQNRDNDFSHAGPIQLPIKFD